MEISRFMMPFDYARNAGSVVIQGLFCLLSGIRRRIVRKMRACMVDGRWSVVGSRVGYGRLSKTPNQHGQVEKSLTGCSPK